MLPIMQWQASNSLCSEETKGLNNEVSCFLFIVDKTADVCVFSRIDLQENTENIQSAVEYCNYNH